MEMVSAGPGTIVWVRRRNGSWWPGRILGQQHLSSSHLLSPRSGTPIKLLGREDASVDWYNLEKSKRVKPFRCGEFDDCIERAEATHGHPVKKREKYARREDAILHALQLEKQYHEEKYGKLPKPLKENSLEPERKIPVIPATTSENCNGKLGNHELCQPDMKVDKSNLIDKNGVLPAQKPKDAIHPGPEDQSLILSSQLRGLQDLRLKAVPTNKMLYPTTSEDSNRTPIDGHAYAVSGSGPCFENSSDSDSRNSTGKGKRLLDGYAEESIPKRHHGLRPFVNRRQNSLELPNHPVQPDMYVKGTRFSLYTPVESSQLVITNQGAEGQVDTPFSRLEVGTWLPQHVPVAEQTVSGSSEETDSDSSETHSIEPRVDAGMLLSDADTRMRAQSRIRDRMTKQPGQEISSNDESDELSLEDRSQFHYLDQNASGAEVSKWQLKGKRNVRTLSKRPIDKFIQTSCFDAKGKPPDQRTASHSMSYYRDNSFANEAEFSEDDIDIHRHGFGESGGYLAPQAAARRQSYFSPSMVDWESAMAWGRPFRKYWEERSGCFMGQNGRDMLIDVDLRVQGKRQGEHVPWVSLMSKLNGKAIIGHPIQIETLEDGSTDVLLLSASDESDGGKVPAGWSTGRRMNSVGVPRPIQSPQQDLHRSGRVGSKKSVGKGNLSKTGYRSPKAMKKAPRKGYLPSNQKTRPLSSIGLDYKVTNKTTSDNVTGYPKDSLIKPVDSVACIPVKLAFSRLLEAVGRPPSRPAKPDNKERNPS